MSGPSLRFALPCDLEALVALETRTMHFPMGHRVREWFRGDHPSVRLRHIAVAVEGDRIVAAAALLPEPVLYRGIRLITGRWEAVVTDDDYRRQGLCRALFGFLEGQYSHPLLLVEGVTWLYRRFGYYPAMHNHGGCNSGGRLANVDNFPESPLETRRATRFDGQFLANLRRSATRRSILASPIGEAGWAHALHPERTVAGPGETGLNRWQEIHILVQDDHPVGYFVHDPWDIGLLMDLEILPGVTTWRAAGATAVRSLAAFSGKAEIRAALSESHPLFAAFPRAFAQSFRASSDWAARIPDLSRFLRRITPALEANLARSALVGWTGEIALTRIDDGFRLSFDKGKLVGSFWLGDEEAANVRLMPGCFEALALGYRSVAEILANDADCQVPTEEVEAVLNALFPKGDSFFAPI